MPPSGRRLEQQEGGAEAWRLRPQEGQEQQAEQVEERRQRGLPPRGSFTAFMFRTAPVMPWDAAQARSLVV